MTFPPLSPGDDENDTCVICGESESSAYNSGTVKFYVNTAKDCQHTFCETCCSRNFDRKKVFACPVCSADVKKSSLTDESLDAKYATSDSFWRKRVMAVYNKSEADFPSLREYNDYLEEVEDIIFCIVNQEPSAASHISSLKKLEHSSSADLSRRAAERAERERKEEEEVGMEQLSVLARKVQRQGEQKEVEAMRKRMRVEENEVRLGDRDAVSEELQHAKKIGFENAVRFSAEAREAAEESGVIRVWAPFSGLGDKSLVAMMGKSAVKLRIAAVGGVQPKSSKDVEMCFEELLGTLWI
mmetsp:Transcript_23977/g.47721  ORF Transcript_23977/g.47721 Transcript_23977/m.47721 type:complete len:299 (-) Transcript_23977:56-952(-)